ncbi:HPr-rel-A system PqqD family peptide chaperone [Paucibacter sp. hw1]|uniref:HPr-rel-A system PqqD family peptide chaperone n=1 Tax=Roseateles koreensis TaxID=2987526 RepID=A0ABT5KPQ5_9BURK|nr:HPr-rel-A system PqqD family peptide chaperone [Roseateles koreensis]
MPPCWRAAFADALTLRWLDEDLLVFNALSGDTHLLTASGSALLQGLLESPARAWKTPELARHLLSEEPSDTLLDQMQRSLNYLWQLGLIERVAS